MDIKTTVQIFKSLGKIMGASSIDPVFAKKIHEKERVLLGNAITYKHDLLEALQILDAFVEAYNTSYFENGGQYHPGSENYK